MDADTLSHLAKDITSAITRSCRIYQANHEAGFIHLHRVAYKHLPPTSEVLRGQSTIKRIARLFGQTGDSLPTNFIWPLVMACCEDDEVQDDHRYVEHAGCSLRCQTYCRCAGRSASQTERYKAKS